MWMLVHWIHCNANFICSKNTMLYFFSLLGVLVQAPHSVNKEWLRIVGLAETCISKCLLPSFITISQFTLLMDINFHIFFCWHGSQSHIQKYFCGPAKQYWNLCQHTFKHGLEIGGRQGKLKKNRQASKPTVQCRLYSFQCSTFSMMWEYGDCEPLWVQRGAKKLP